MKAFDVKIGISPISWPTTTCRNWAATRRWKPSCPRAARSASAPGWWSKPSKIRRLRRATNTRKWVSATSPDSSALWNVKTKLLRARKGLTATDAKDAKEGNNKEMFGLESFRRR
jgi:hypothetical protein